MAENADSVLESMANLEHHEGPILDSVPLCTRKVCVVGPVPSFICAQPEDSPIHKLSNRGAHPFTLAEHNDGSNHA